ncbi:MAG TPA: hypothetical protein VG649_24045, partial [Candidatus Angelobacter sp.]|nr:hypothetical protein [Candidatus Angelobacter sp.]
NKKYTAFLLNSKTKKGRANLCAASVFVFASAKKLHNAEPLVLLTVRKLVLSDAKVLLRSSSRRG